VQKLVAEAVATDVPRRERLIDATLGVTALVGALTMVGFILSSAWIADGVLDQDALTPLLSVAAALVFLTPCVEVLAALLAAQERFKMVGVFRAAHGCTTGCLLVVVLLFGPGPILALGAIAVAEAVTCVLGWRLLSAARHSRRSGGWTRRGDLLPVVKSLLRVSMPALLASISLQPALWLGQVLLSRQPGGLEQVGTFAVALRWLAIALFVPSTMGSVLLPMLGRLRATGRDADARILFVRYGGMTLAFSIGTSLLVVALAEPLMALQGPEYASGAIVLVILAIAVVPTAMNNVLSQRALAEGQLALWLSSDLALAATLALGAVVLVPVLHGAGLAWSYLLAYAATCIVLLPVMLAARKRVQST
jgi:O-antigen/teichoic acid export membrane protein